MLAIERGGHDSSVTSTINPGHPSSGDGDAKPAKPAKLSKPAGGKTAAKSESKETEEVKETKEQAVRGGWYV